MIHNNQHFQKISLESVNFFSYIADDMCRLPRYLLHRGKNRIMEKLFWYCDWNSDFILFHIGTLLTGNYKAACYILTDFLFRVAMWFYHTCSTWADLRHGAMRQPLVQGAQITSLKHTLWPLPRLCHPSLNLSRRDMAAIEELSPSAGPVSTRPPEDEIDDDEDEDVSVQSVCLFWSVNKTFGCFNFLTIELYTCRLTD